MYYCLGVIRCLAAFKPDIITLEQDNKAHKIEITHFDWEKLGIDTVERLKENLLNSDKKFYPPIFDSLDEYFTPKVENSVD